METKLKEENHEPVNDINVQSTTGKEELLVEDKTVPTSKNVLIILYSGLIFTITILLCVSGFILWTFTTIITLILAPVALFLTTFNPLSLSAIEYFLIILVLPVVTHLTATIGYKLYLTTRNSAYTLKLPMAWLILVTTLTWMLVSQLNSFEFSRNVTPEANATDLFIGYVVFTLPLIILFLLQYKESKFKKDLSVK